MKTKIEWATDVWNPVTGCTKVSAGCAHCYAERMSKRLAGRCGYPADQPFRVTLHANKLDEPLHWKRPRRVFVCSMGDLFHEDVPDSFISQVLHVISHSYCAHHIFMVLTKRPERMCKFFAENPGPTIQNLWLGTSVENQEAADERIPWLLKTQAAVRFVSCEPLLGPVDLFAHTGETEPIDPYPQKLDWLICGGESGPGARPMHPDWALSLRNQCVNANVPFFFKRWGDWEPVGKTVEGKGNYLAVGEGFRWGKTATGHLLSGREWRDIPNSCQQHAETAIEKRREMKMGYLPPPPPRIFQQRIRRPSPPKSTPKVDAPPPPPGPFAGSEKIRKCGYCGQYTWAWGPCEYCGAPRRQQQ